MGSFQVRQASPHEWPQVAAWLPQTFMAMEDAPACIFVAVRPTGELCGAAVVRQVADRHQRPLGRFLIYVPPEQRRQGIGTALVTELYRLSYAARFSKLVVFDAVPESADFRPFFSQQGMTSQLTLSEFRFDAEDFRQKLEPLYRFAVGRSPAVRPEQLQSIYAMPPQEVARFSAGSLGLPGMQEQLIRGRRYCPVASLGVMAEGRMVAVLLCRRLASDPSVTTHSDGSVLVLPNTVPQPYRLVVDYVRVAPEYPMGPVSIILIYVATVRSLEAGMVGFQYEADEERYPTFYHLARRWEAEESSRTLQFASTPDVWHQRLASLQPSAPPAAE